jgi:uncharacterized membrane protein
MKPRTFWIIYIIAIILRVVWLNVPPLWYDENFTLILARLPFGEMLNATAGDVHPPLWYVIEWAVMHISPNLPAWAIRIPALLFSLGSIPLFVAILAILKISPKVQTAALFMMAVMPFQLWYAQEGRMYAMLEFFVLLTLLAALTQNYWLIFLGSLAMLYTQNYGPFYLAAIALVVSFRERINKLNLTIAAMTSAGVLWLPWVYVIYWQMRGIEDRYWIVAKGPGAILTIVYKLFLTASVPHEFVIASYLVTFGALIVGLYTFMRSHHPERLTIAIMAFVPLLLAWTVSVLWQPVVLFRAFIGISPFLYLIVSWIMEVLRLPCQKVI